VQRLFLSLYINRKGGVGFRLLRWLYLDSSFFVFVLLREKELEERRSESPTIKRRN